MISTLTKEALRLKRSRGEYCGGKVPYGYMRTQDGKNVFPDPEELRIMHKIQELARSGVTYRTIADVLEVDGDLTRDGKKFQPGQIARMVHSPVVLG